MARYDWPAGPISTDDSPGRQAFNRAYRPAANERLADGSLAPLPEPPKARRSRRALKAPPQGGNDLWLPIGPTTVIAGQATGRPQVSGRVRDLAIEPATGDRIYAATAGGGVWFSANRGASWRPIDGFVVSPNRTSVTPVGSALSCGAIYVRFSGNASGADDEIYVGTGEPSGFITGDDPGGDPGGSLLGVGILRRDNSTGQWQVDPGSGPLRGQFVWRIVASPLDDNHLFAATSDGVYHRPLGMPWMKLVAHGRVADVLVTSNSPSTLRVWVATFTDVAVGTLNLPVAAPPPPPGVPPLLAVTAVALNNGLPLTCKALALGAPDQLWVLGRRSRTGKEKIDPAHLWRIDPTVPPVATEVGGVPADLFGDTNDQSTYDMCITVHPEATDRLFVGGSGLTTHGQWNAGLYSLAVSGNTVDPTLLGVGVHADVHIIRVGPRVLPPGTDRAVWVGCDGGLFMSGGDGRADTFVTRNNELATLEPGYVACHPTNDGIVAAGMQDNGTCERRGDTIWALTQMGDGGGTVYDPAHEHRFFRQYVKADWEASDSADTRPVKRRHDEGETSSETIEDKASLFYSGAAALAHGDTTHLLIGTDRPWYSADWGRHWVTVPTNRDPRATDNVDLEQDLINRGPITGQYTDSVPTFLCCHGDVHGHNRVGSAVITTRLSAADDGATTRVRAHCLWGGGLSMFLGTKPATTGAPWTWAKEVVEPIQPTNTGVERTTVDDGLPTPFLPARDFVTDVAVHLPGRGAHGSCYVTTLGQMGQVDGLGAVTVETVDTVWWYDGDGTFVPCGVRNTNANTHSTWTGDRIIAPAMAVVVDPIDPNVVFVGTSIGVIRGELSMPIVNGVEEPHWAWRAFDNGLPESAVNDLAIFSDGSLHLLRAALHGRGVWEVDLGTVVAQARTFLRVLPSDTRRRPPPTPISGPATHGETNLRFDSSPDIVIDRTSIIDGAEGPTEADLFERGNGLSVGEHASVALSERTFRVHVLVHHRWPFEAAPAQVKVVLLRKDLAEGVDDPPLGGIWATLVDLANGTPAPTPLPGSWEKAGTQLVRPIAAATDARRPRAATFDINLAGHDDGRVMLMAVVMSGPDPIDLAEAVKPDTSVCTTLSELVLHSRHVAARSIELT